MNEWMQDIPAKSEYSNRFIEFLNAGLDADTIETVNFNVVDYQQKMGDVRIDRTVPPKRDGMTRKAFELREAERV